MYYEIKKVFQPILLVALVVLAFSSFCITANADEVTMTTATTTTITTDEEGYSRAIYVADKTGYHTFYSADISGLSYSVWNCSTEETEKYSFSFSYDTGISFNVYLTEGVTYYFTTSGDSTASYNLRITPYVEVELASDYADINRGDTYQIEFEDSSVVKKATYTSSDTTCLKVSKKGLITAIGATWSAYVTVTATDIYGGVHELIFYAYVEEADASISYDSTSLAKGKKMTITVNNPQVLKSYSFTSSNTSVATVSSKGVVKAKAKGYTKITVKGKDINGSTFKETFKLYVSNPTASTNLVGLNIYGCEKCDGVYYTDDCDSLTITGLSDYSEMTIKSSSKYLRVDGYNCEGTGYVYMYPKKKGTYTVTITVDGKTLKCKVKVFKAYFVMDSKDGYSYASKKWNSTYSFLNMYKGESTVLKAKGLGSNLTWSSTDTSVATVNKKGKVIAKGIGEADITVSSGTSSISYHIEVSTKYAVNAIRYAIKVYGAEYSQSLRMKEGYYDCSSYVWRSYNSAGYKVGSTALTAAGMAQWCVNNGYMIFCGSSKNLIDIDDLLPGDIIFECGASNGRYMGIYHADLYIGNGISLSVNRDKDWYTRLEKTSYIMVARPTGVTTTGLKSKATKTGVQLSWKTTFGATKYEVYRSTSKTGNYTLLTTTANTSFLDTTTKTGKTYYYKVRAYYKSAKTYYATYTSVVSAKALKITKLPTTTATIKSTSTKKIKVGWSGISGATSYKVYRSTKESSGYKLVATVTSKSYTDKDVEAGKTYYYKIVATDGKKSSAKSVAVSAAAE